MQAETGASLIDADDNRPVKGSRSSGYSGRHLGSLIGVAAAVYAADQGAKAWAVHHLSDGSVHNFLGSFLRLRLIYNPGAAFSFATNATWVLTIIAVVVIVAVFLYARRLRSILWSVALGLVVGGACGNLTDRFSRPPGGGQGHVVDFLELPHWPIFNIADGAICCAAALIVLLTLRGEGLDGVRAANKSDSTDATSDQDIHDSGLEAQTPSPKKPSAEHDARPVSDAREDEGGMS